MIRTGTLAQGEETEGMGLVHPREERASWGLKVSRKGLHRQNIAGSTLSRILDWRPQEVPINLKYPVILQFYKYEKDRCLPVFNSIC